MRNPLLALLMLLGGWASQAQAQPASTDTLYRAAYCVGVLKSAIKAVASEPSSVRIAGGVQGVLDDYEKQRTRYASYVMLRTQGRPSPWLGALVARGEADQTSDATNEKASEAAVACFRETDNTSDFVGCLARHDQAYANRWACLSEPDRLPF